MIVLNHLYALLLINHFLFINIIKCLLDLSMIMSMCDDLLENMTFSFKIETKKAIKVRLEYSIDYVKASGKRNRKIFQISEIYLKENMKKFYAKKHCFADISTRITGTHSISLIVNGTTWDTLILRCWLLNSLINYLINLLDGLHFIGH